MNLTSYWLAYVASDGPPNKRSTRVHISEEIIDAQTESAARLALRRELRNKGFSTVRITRSKIVTKA